MWDGHFDTEIAGNTEFNKVRTASANTLRAMAERYAQQQSLPFPLPKWRNLSLF